MEQQLFGEVTIKVPHEELDVKLVYYILETGNEKTGTPVYGVMVDELDPEGGKILESEKAERVTTFRRKIESIIYDLLIGTVFPVHLKEVTEYLMEEQYLTG